MSNPTIVDLLDRTDEKGNLREIVEVLQESNEMLDDISWVQANSKQMHKTTVRTGLPDVTWRKLNYGVKPSKSKTATITDSCGMLEAFAVVDKKLCELNGGREKWRMSENAAFLEAMGQAFQRALIYGDSSKDPEQIMGLAPRFNTVNVDKAENAINVINAKGTGSKLTSIWLVAWGDQTVHCIYPEGSTAGLHDRDLGEEAAVDESGGEYRVFKTHYEWDVGLTVRDWRAVVRIANIDITKCKPKPGTGDTDLIDLMTEALERVRAPAGARLVFYCNRTIRTALRKQIRNANNVHITMEEVAGKQVVAFDGVPVRTVDALTPNETQVQ